MATLLYKLVLVYLSLSPLFQLQSSKLKSFTTIKKRFFKLLAALIAESSLAQTKDYLANRLQTNFAFSPTGFIVLELFRLWVSDFKIALRDSHLLILFL